MSGRDEELSPAERRKRHLIERSIQRARTWERAPRSVTKLNRAIEAMTDLLDLLDPLDEEDG
jgi:hypothetical protein